MSAGRSPGARRLPSQRRGARTVEAILDATERLAGEYGYDAVTTNQVAGAAGISIGTLYHYFANKTEIFYASADRAFRAYEAHLEAACAAGADDPTAAAHYARLVRAAARWWAGNAAFMALWQAIGHRAEMVRAARDHADRIGALMTGWVAARPPAMPAPARRMVGRVLHRTIAAVLDAGLGLPERDRAALIAELEAVAIGYVDRRRASRWRT